jgi:hypothetical protein
MLHAACCLLPRCLLSVARRLWSFPRCLLSVCPSPVAVARCLLRCMSLLLAAYCVKSGACCLLRVACRLLFAVYCPLHVVRMVSVACCMSCRPLPFPRRMSHVSCPTPVPSLQVVCCMVHTARPVLHVVSGPFACPILHVCCMPSLQSDTAPSRTQSIVAAHRNRAPQ